MGALALALALVALVHTYLVQPVRVKGSSMEHTLKNGEMLLVTKPGAYRRGEVVICRYPNRVEERVEIGAAFTVTLHTVFVKRLVALPGDSVEIRLGQLYVNDEAVPNPPEMASAPRDYPRRELGENEYFVMGDNRFSSHDSRAADVGPLSGEMLRGHVKRVIWPLNRMRKVE